MIGFAASFTFLSFSLKTLPLSAAYATWAGTGTALTAAIGYFIFQEPFNLKTLIGLVLIICGVFCSIQSMLTPQTKRLSSRSKSNPLWRRQSLGLIQWRHCPEPPLISYRMSPPFQPVFRQVVPLFPPLLSEGGSEVCE